MNQTASPANPRKHGHSRGRDGLRTNIVSVPRTAVTRPAVPRPGGRGLGVRHRGSLLILCVTILVIIALIGIAFLQRVRMDQFASRGFERNYMNLVINGIIDDVSVQIEKDVEENLTNARLYDYPWTKDAREIQVTLDNGTTTVMVNGSGQGNDPDHQDDRWLASTAPVYVPSQSQYRWLHLSNLGGVWLDLENNNPQQPINGTIPGNIINTDTDISLNQLQSFAGGRAEPLGVDADGDGIADSRWQWTPTTVRDLGGRKFVMALRIIDLDSMLNLNTATALLSNGSSNQSTGLPDRARGYNPAWVDLSRLFTRIDPSLATQSEGSIELADLINKVRIMPLPSSFGVQDYDPNFGNLSVTEVQKLWEQQGSIYGNTDRKLAIESELDLRSLGGINDTTQNSALEAVMGFAYPAGQQLSKLLRQHPAIVASLPNQSELAYTDVVGIGGTVEARISRWFYGGDDPVTVTLEDGDSLPVKDRRFRAIRHMLTTASGTAVYAPKYGGFLSAGQRNKFDLNFDWTGPNTANDLDDLTDQISSVLMLPNIGTLNDPNKYLGQDENFLRDLIAEYVIAIKDYSDPDSNPTARPISGDTAYGMEKLPFIREVYFHQLYEDQNLLGIDGTNPINAATNPDDGIYDTWVAKSGAQGVVIELGNPFSHEIRGDVLDGGGGPQGLIKVVIEQGGADVDSWIYNDPAANKQNIGPRDDAAADTDTLLLVSNQTDPTTDGSGLGVDLTQNLNLNGAANLLTLSDGDLTFQVGGGPITIRLEVDVDGSGTFVPYDRLVTNISFTPNLSPSHPPSSTPLAPANPQYVQSSFWRNGDKINFVSDGTGIGRFKTPPNITSPPVFGDHQHHLLSDNKIPLTPGTPLPDSMQLPLPDLPMRSIAEVAWVHMFGFTASQTFPERMASIPLDEHFLLLDPTSSNYRVLPPPNSSGLPHAALLMDVITTVSPADDGRDNDNDDGDNITNTSADTIVNGRRVELFVPGTINVNTAPLHILTLGSPLGENLDETEKLMRTIVAYRDEPIRGRPSNSHGDYWSATPFNDADIRNLVSPGGAVIDRQTKNDPGIASLGELLFLNPVSQSLPGIDSGHDMMRYGLDTNPDFPPGTKVDLYPSPDDTTANGASVNKGDDNEQRIARFGMLSQAYTVRSDRFIVYGVVRGYDSGQFGEIVEPTARFIAILDRGSMADPSNDSPRVIGFIRLQ